MASDAVVEVENVAVAEAGECYVEVHFVFLSLCVFIVQLVAAMKSLYDFSIAVCAEVITASIAET